jgi:two-component system, response regulator
MPFPRILLVEDDPDEEMLIRRALNRSGVPHLLDVARDADEALSLAMMPVPADGHVVIWLDLQLGRVGGLEVLRELRNSGVARFVPIVVFASTEDPEKVEASYREGANSYVRKPVDSDAFARTVETMGRYWLSSNLPPSPI